MLGGINRSLIGVMSISATIGELLVKSCFLFLCLLLQSCVCLSIGMMNGILIAKLKTVPLIETMSTVEYENVNYTHTKGDKNAPTNRLTTDMRAHR